MTIKRILSLALIFSLLIAGKPLTLSLYSRATYLSPNSPAHLPSDLIRETILKLSSLKPDESIHPTFRPLIEHLLNQTPFRLVSADESPFLLVDGGLVVRVINTENEEGLIFIELHNSFFQEAEELLFELFGSQELFDNVLNKVRIAEAWRWVNENTSKSLNSRSFSLGLFAFVTSLALALVGCPGGNNNQKTGPQTSNPPTNSTLNTTPPDQREQSNEENLAGGVGPDPDNLAQLGLHAKIGFDRWLQRVSRTRTGLPVSHYGDRETAQGAFTYDLAHPALRFARDGQHEQARLILDFFISRYQRLPLSRLRRLADDNNVYGILRVLPNSNNEWQVYIINAVDTSNTTEPGAGIVEWFTDGGPQFWLGLATVNELHRNSNLDTQTRQRYEAFLRSIIEIGRGLMNEESIVAAGPRNQNIGGAPDRNRLGHVENMWDFVGLLDSAAAYFGESNNPLARGYRQTSLQILINLREKGIYSQEGNLGWFWQGFENGRINQQIPTDVQSWGILAVGPERIDQIWGEGTSERVYRNMIQTMLVQNEYVRPDNRRIISIGADYGDPHRADFVSARGGTIGVISDEWTAGVIVAIDRMAQFFQSRGETQKAQEALAMADALRYFMILRANRTQNGEFSLPYATHQNVQTGFGWHTPNSQESLASLWGVFALAGSSLQGGANPFHLNGEINLEGIEHLGVRRGIELLEGNLRSNNRFTQRPLTQPGADLEAVQPQVEQTSTSSTGFQFLQQQGVRISYFSSQGEGVGRIPSERDTSIGIESISGWNTVEVKLAQALNVTDQGYRYLTFQLKASSGAQRIKVNFVDQGYLDRAHWHVSPPSVTVNITGDNNWHEVRIDLTDLPRSARNTLPTLRALSFDVGSVNRSGLQFQIDNPQFLMPEGSRKNIPNPGASFLNLHVIDPKTWESLGRTQPLRISL